MNDPDTDGNGDVAVPDALLDVLRDPARGRQRLPYLLGLLDEGTVRVRLSAAWALCLVVEADPDLLEYAVRRLVDRLDPGPSADRPDDARLEVQHVLDYLATRHPRAVDEALADLDEEREVRARERLYDTTGSGRPRFNGPPSAPDRERTRTRVAGESADDPRRVYTDPDGEAAASGATEDGSAAADGKRAADEADGAGDADGADDTGDGNRTGDIGGAGGDGTSDADDGTGPSVTSGTLTLVRRRLAEVIAASRFDDLSVLDDRRRERHADVYRAVAEVGTTEHPVALWVFHLPTEGRQGYAADLCDRLDRWAGLDDTAAIQTVLDWGRRPRPWAAVEYAGETLADRDRIGVDAAVAETRRLATAVADAHRHGVVHGGIDPEAVVYRANELVERAPRRPLLSEVGLASPARAHGSERAPDPRYTAPEHVDDRVGSVDAATDVYGLGTVCYRLCTGEAPYSERQVRAREHADGSDPPVPSDVIGGVPPALDRVVGKALSARKLTRYETVTALARELAAVDGETDG